MRLPRFLNIAFITIFIAIASTSTAWGVPKAWESVKSEHPSAKSVLKEAEIEVKTLPGTIIVTTNHAMQVKVFTILGRLVSCETVPAGTSQHHLPAHGIYIVTIGELTVKVAV